MNCRALRYGLTVFLAGLTFFSAFAQEEKVRSAPLRIRILDKETGEESASFRFRLQAGQQDKNSLFIRNTTPGEIAFKLYVADGRTTPDLSLDGPTDGEPRLNTGKWLSLSQDTLRLGPGQSGTVEVTAQIPEGSVDREYLGFVFLQPLTSPKTEVDDSGVKGVAFGVNVETRMGLPVVMHIGAPKTLNLTALGVEKRYYRGQVSLQCRFRNDGTLLAKPEGSWTLAYPDGTPLVSSPMHHLGYCLPGSDFVITIPLQANNASGAQPLPRGNYSLKMLLKNWSIFPGVDPVLLPVEQQLNLP